MHVWGRQGNIMHCPSIIHEALPASMCHMAGMLYWFRQHCPSLDLNLEKSFDERLR